MIGIALFVSSHRREEQGKMIDHPNMGPIAIEREKDGRWIAEAVMCPGLVTYGVTAMDAYEALCGLYEEAAR